MPARGGLHRCAGATVAIVEPPDVPLADIDLSSFDFWLEPEVRRDAAFRTLRNTSPVHWCEGFTPLDGAFPTDGRGYWSLTRYDDIWHASRNPRSSAAAGAG